ncbi:hypothetical protein QR685DRAFT_495010 [Neurospora intermedia]|uniref:Uncharacterized protein n=1 Tax=Neurospora intermedia TaxID=5142 RepID=A0ABR3DJM6_NEUIN
MDSLSSKEALSIDTITDSLTPATTATNLHSTTSKPHPKRTLSDTAESTTCPSISSSSPLVTPSKDTDSTSPSTASATTPPSSLQATPSPTAHLSSITKSRQPTTPVIPDSLSTDTQGTTISKPKTIVLHHDTIIDGRRIIIRTIQNCFAAILGPNAPQPSETAILNAFAHNATLGEALSQLGAFKTSGKPNSSFAAAEAANSDTGIKSSSKDQGKGKAKVIDPTSPPTQEEQQYDYHHAIALWTQAYLHYTHEFLSEFDIYPDLEPFAKQMKQQDVNVVILIAQDGFESSSSSSSPDQTSSTDGDKDGKKQKQKKKQQQPATPAQGVMIIQELMRRMGVTAAGKGARGYQGQGRQAAAVGGATSAVVVVGGIYASGIEGEAVARVWKGDILPGFQTTPQIAIAQEANLGGGEGNASKETDTEIGTVAADSPAMRKDEVLFACCSKQYLGLARAIGATACWVTRCEDKKAGERQADIVVEDLEKLGELVVGDRVSNGKGEKSMVDARHSRQRDESGISTSEKKKKTPKNKSTTITTEDVDMPDADCNNDGAAVDQKIEEPQNDGSEGTSERKLASSKAMKVVKTEQVEDNSVATVAQQKGSTGKKRTRDDVEEWLPVEMGGEEVPVVDLTEEP